VSRIDLLLHPIRIRIIQAIAGKPLTPGHIAQEIPDIPLTTLYRHINALVDGGILEVVEERPVRGTLEKVYALVEGAARVRPEEIAEIGDEDQLRYFMIFLASLLQDFSRYLDSHQTMDTRMREVVYNKAALYLTEEQYHALAEQVRALVMPYVTAPEGVDAKRYLVALFGIPEG
jgi:DNA-binding transcriptional ArsR family regulator